MLPGDILNKNFPSIRLSKNDKYENLFLIQFFKVNKIYSNIFSMFIVTSNFKRSVHT